MDFEESFLSSVFPSLTEVTKNRLRGGVTQHPPKHCCWARPPGFLMSRTRSCPSSCNTNFLYSDSFFFISQLLLLFPSYFFTPWQDWNADHEHGLGEGVLSCRYCGRPLSCQRQDHSTVVSWLLGLSPKPQGHKLWKWQIREYFKYNFASRRYRETKQMFSFHLKPQ